jgi:hypothetical protein
MFRKYKKPRTEAQRRHDVLLRESNNSPAAYCVATLEVMATTVKQHREKVRAVEADAEHNKKALIDAEKEVRSSVRNERV